MPIRFPWSKANGKAWINSLRTTKKEAQRKKTNNRNRSRLPLRQSKLSRICLRHQRLSRRPTAPFIFPSCRARRRTLFRRVRQKPRITVRMEAKTEANENSIKQALSRTKIGKRSSNKNRKNRRRGNRLCLSVWSGFRPKGASLSPTPSLSRRKRPRRSRHRPRRLQKRLATLWRARVKNNLRRSKAIKELLPPFKLPLPSSDSPRN